MKVFCAFIFRNIFQECQLYSNMSSGRSRWSSISDQCITTEFNLSNTCPLPFPYNIQFCNWKAIEFVSCINTSRYFINTVMIWLVFVHLGTTCHQFYVGWKTKTKTRSHAAHWCERNDITSYSLSNEPNPCNWEVYMRQYTVTSLSTCLVISINRNEIENHKWALSFCKRSLSTILRNIGERFVRKYFLGPKNHNSSKD